MIEMSILDAPKDNLSQLLKTSHVENGGAVHHVRSSNLPFYTTLWDTAKRCQGVVGFNQKFIFSSNGLQHEARCVDHDRKEMKRKGSVVVDIVAKGGAEWVKVSTTTEQRILYELAEIGWGGSDCDSDDGSHDDAHHQDQAGDAETSKRDGRSRRQPLPTLSLLTLAQDLRRASGNRKISQQRPKIRLVLPRLELGRQDVVDSVLDQIRQMGIVVQAGSSSSPSTSSPPPLDEETWSRMAVDEFADFTSTVNIDCTILLALVSDLSHQPITIEPCFHVAIQRQIQREQVEQVVPSLLWPAMADRELVCTYEAARRMREIVDTIGTSTEKARTAILMDHDLRLRDDDDDVDQQHLLTSFQSLSSHTVPSTWRIPIKIVVPMTKADEIDISGLPPVAGIIRDQLTRINRSVFLFGWVNGLTTLSSNRSVLRLITDILCEHSSSYNNTTSPGDDDDDDDPTDETETVEDGRGIGNQNKRVGRAKGPHIWLCHTARSLLGKEKAKR